MLAVSGSALAATAGLYGFSRRASAVDVTVQQLQVDDQTLGSPVAPSELQLSISGDYAVDANVEPDSLKLIPQAEVVSSPHGLHKFDAYETELQSRETTGTFDLARNLMAVYALRDLFPATEGKTASRDVRLRLLAAVYADNKQIGTAETQAAFTLTLEHVAASANVGLQAVGDVELIRE